MGTSTGSLTQLHFTQWPGPALITEAGARAPKALITVAMSGTATGCRKGQAGGWSWQVGQGSRGKAGWGRTAHLGNGVQRPRGRRAHKLSRQTPNGTCTARCRSCRPCTRHGHYRGGWHPQGKLGGGAGEVKWGQGLLSGRPLTPQAAPAQSHYPSCTQWQPRVFQRQQPTHIPMLLRTLQGPSTPHWSLTIYTPIPPLRAFSPSKIHSPPQPLSTPTPLRKKG